jgi:hypothetical protein
MDNDEVPTCVICGGTPCELEEFGGGVVEQSKLLYNREQCGKQDVRVDDNGVIVPNSRMRKALYRAFTYLKFVHLGKGRIIPIPSCVTTKIREMYPETDGDYMGFHEE